ncbi:probable methyltransferase-like protein 23 [Gallus gallus]|uniref:probable methyltransferase-like protein 23 n=1 Tax=Gallus gallus TaxID=9031 RepID=UPI001EFF6698|nr:probable methyltransferase-like protein 23 [Gallus gallus]XP_040542133.2 probable methyltransferase-like protein 23 [Gallus gallus]
MGEPRRAVRRYRFVGDSAGGEERAVLVLRVPEVLDPQYGMYAWPCAVVLAQYVWFHRRTLPGRRVLEIGAGVSLPGIVAAKCGAQVTLSDSEELPQCLEISQQSCLLNHLPHVPVVGITWGRISPELLSLAPIDIILGSDVFFDPKDFEDILTTVYFLLEKNPHAQFWTTYQVRSADWSIEALLYKWKLKSIHIPLHSFSADKEHLASSSLPSRHTIEMMIISLARSDGGHSSFLFRRLGRALRPGSGVGFPL